MNQHGKSLGPKDVGRLGESLAEKFLRSRGYVILHRNYTTPFGEIDLVGKKEGRTIFIEVKTRISERFGPPLSAIDSRKQYRLLKNCMFYIKHHDLFGKKCRIDAIGIYVDGRGKCKILQHVKNAVQLIERNYTC